MSDNRTREMKDPRSFEERVFMRFDAMDARFDGMDARLERVETRLGSLDERVEKLEAKQYDTKPIWEKALAAILEVGSRVDETNSRIDQLSSGIDKLDSRLDETNSRIDQLSSRIDKLDSRLDETNSRIDQMSSRIDQLDSRLDETNVRIDQMNTRMEQGFEQLRAEMNAGFANQQERTDHLIRDVYFQIEALSHNVLKLQANQSYFNVRLTAVETTLKEPGP